MSAVDEAELIGKPTDDVPKRDPSETDCNARKSKGGTFVGYCSAWPGKNTDHVGEGRCHLHGGNAVRGPDHPDFEHGLFADYVAPEDREAMEVLEEYDSAEKLEELIDWRLARLRGACRRMNESEKMSFWDAFAELVERQESPDADEIRELAGMLETGNRALQEEVDLVRKLISDYDKVADKGSGESLRRLFGAGGPAE